MDPIIADIRKMKAEDAESVAMLSGQFGYPSSMIDIKERMLKLKEFPDNCGFVAIYKKEIIGWIHVMLSVHIESPLFYEISGLVIDERFRGKGIGTQLVDTVKSWCAGKGIQKLRVRCNITRLRSHEFYLNLGFHETKISKIFEMKLEDV